VNNSSRYVINRSGSVQSSRAAVSSQRGQACVEVATACRPEHGGTGNRLPITAANSRREETRCSRALPKRTAPYSAVPGTVHSAGKRRDGSARPTGQLERVAVRMLSRKDWHILTAVVIVRLRSNA
jgi:hypothetical protein